MTKCTQCRRPTDLFICKHCQTELRNTLNDLPGWITALQEDAWGQTRHGESVRRSTDLGSPALCKLGANGSFARSPGQLLVYTRSVLLEWTRDLVGTRGILFAPQTVESDFHGPLQPGWHRLPPDYDTPANLARWLARHITNIAKDPAAAVAYREIHQIRHDIEKRVDRPRSPLYAGQCPTTRTTGENENQTTERCLADLVIPVDAKHVQCRACKTTFDIGGLVEKRLDELPPDVLFTAAEVLDVMDIIRTPIPDRTWRRWRALGHVQPCGELYGEPAYRIQDARDFRKKWTRQKTA